MTSSRAILIQAPLINFAMAALAPSPLVGVPVAISLFISPTANAALFATILRTSPQDMTGRVTSTFVMLATGLAAVAPLVAGVAAQRMSPHWALGLFAIVMAASAIVAVTFKGLREVEDPRINGGLS